jgi:tripartite-type tricarboxylate transporter receptor subunit TctC
MHRCVLKHCPPKPGQPIGMSNIVAQSLVPKMPYDTERDLAAISLVNWHYHVVAVAATAPVRSVADLVTAARARPGVLKYSSGGNGTPAHLPTELLKREARVDITHIPYKGAPAGVQALLGGEVDVMIGSSTVLAPHLKAGKLRGIATPAPLRIGAYPELPTLIEVGYPGVQVRDWQAVVAPARTSAKVIERLHVEIAKTVALPDVRQRLEGLGLEAASAGPNQLAAHIRSEIQRWNGIVRDAGIRAD